MRATLLWILLFPAAVLAQGAASGSVVNIASAADRIQYAPVCAIFLPKGAHPFNEITSATWQEAFTAIAEGRSPETPLGGLDHSVTPTGFKTVSTDEQGAFKLDGLPLNTRIGLAARVDDLWWPLRQELWLTDSTPVTEVSIAVCRLGAPIAEIARYQLEARMMPLRNDLRFGMIGISETLRVTNNDPLRGALVEFSLPVAMIPGLTGAQLPALYGRQLLYMQGWNLAAPMTADLGPAAEQAWRLGTTDIMHGGKPEFGDGAQASADNWHGLQGTDVMAMCGAGDTQYRVTDQADGRGAVLTFRRVVPPALGGKPGVLEIRLRHFAGAATSEPGRKTRIVRAFPQALQTAAANLGFGIEMQALVTDSHRKLFSESTDADGMRNLVAAREPALDAGEAVDLVLGFDDRARQMLAEAETAAASAGAASPAQAAARSALDFRNLFVALAVLFGMGFLVALVASLRKPREKQLEKLNQLGSPRDEVMRALFELESDLKAQRIPAASYLEQKQRLMNRLIESDTGGR